MEIGNNFVGLETSDNYFALILFPFGLEVLYHDNVSIIFTVGIFQMSICFDIDRALFRD